MEDQVRPNPRPLEHKGVVMEVPGPKCKGCSGTLTPLREYLETNAGRTWVWNADSSHLAVPVCGLFIANGVSPRQIESALSRRSVLSQALPLF
jgi:hypothetical protein